MSFDELEQLQEAVRNSPDNLPLRKLLANAFMERERYEEAEIEYKSALKMAPEDSVLKLGLGQAFLAQKKTTLGLVLIEELTETQRGEGAVWLLYAKLLLESGDAAAAADAYHKAIDLKPSLADSYLESLLNHHNQEQASEPEKIRLGGAEEEDDEGSTIDIERPKIGFDQVGGMESLKEEIRLKIIHPLAHPEIYKAYGKKIGGGILMYGPPGCGKTYLARATAGEINANFIVVGINDILNMYLGQSERNLHAIFEKARQLKPCVLFFDEVDALGANRSDMRQSAGRGIINMFLNELDGVQHSNEGVLILAATNAPWHLDPAFRRPGRFDRIIFVPPPDEASREAILNIQLESKPTSKIDARKLIKRTAEYSGADIQAIVDMAIEAKLGESMKQGRPLPIETNDLLKAIKRHRPTTKEWFSTAKNYALFSNEGGLYDDILDYLKIKKLMPVQ